MSGTGNMRLAVVITGDAGNLRAEVKAVEGDLKGMGRAGEQAGQQLGGGMQIAAAAARTLAPLLGAAGVAGGIMHVARAGDAMTTSLNRLQAATGSVAEASRVYEELGRLALQTGVAAGESAGAFARFSIAAREIGATNTEVVQLVRTIQQAGAIAGSSTQETASATLQLSQALASGRLQGDELRSILEAMPNLAEELARALGVSIGELRRMGEAGELTSRRVFDALLQASTRINEQFQQLTPTMSQSFSVLGVAMTTFVERLDRAAELSQTIAAAARAAANALNSIRVGVGLGTPQETAERGQARSEARISELNRRIVAAEAATNDERPPNMTPEQQRRWDAQFSRDPIQQGRAQQLAALRAERDEATRELERFTLLREQEERENLVANLQARVDAGVVRGRNLGQGEFGPPAPPAPAALTARGGAVHRPERDPLGDRISSIDAAIQGERRLAAATLEGGRASAMAEARNRAAAEALQMSRDGTVSYEDALRALTARYAALADAQGEARAATLEFQDTQARAENALRGNLIGATAAERARQTAEFRRRQELDRAGIDPNSDRGRGLVAAAAAEAGQRLDLDRQEAAFERIGQFGERAFERIGESVTRMAAEGKMSFKDLGNIGNAIASELMQEFTRLALMNPLRNMLLGNNLPTLLDVGARLLPSVLGAAMGGLTAYGGVSPAGAIMPGQTYVPGFTPGLHSGGIAGLEATFLRAVPPSVFANAPRFHGGGMIGPNEVPAILERGEGVFTPEQMRALGPAGDVALGVRGGDVHLSVNFEGGDLGNARDQARMAEQLRAVVRQEVAAAAPGIARGAHQLTLEEARRGGRTARELGRR